MKLCDESLCTGCGACVNMCPNSCISMVRNTQGFDYPQINEDKCVECGLCEKLCAKVMGGLEERNPQAYSMTLNDDEVLKHSSSGGAAYALSKYVLENGGSVFGAIYTEDFHVHHIGISNIEDLKKLQGSKYVQSSTELCFKEAKKALLSEKKVLYFGTPCQIRGLYACLDGVDISNLITCDLLCGGVPSPGIFEKYIKELIENKGHFDCLSFRSKKYGYGYGYLVTIKNNTGHEVVLKRSHAYFVKTVGAGYVRNSCIGCRFGNINRVGDITIGDFYHLKISSKQFQKGVSLILANTAKGDAIIKNISKSPAVIIECRTLSDVKKSQGCSITGSKKKPKNYDNFFSDWKSLSWMELSKKYLAPKSRKERIVESIPPFILAFLRDLRRKMR